MISIIIPNYNGKKYLKGCLDAIYDIEQLNFEVIIIDNASQDDDFKWLSQYSNLHFKQLDKNYGFSRAVNEGIRLAKGEYVLLLNNDTVIEKNFVQELVKTIKKDKRIFAVSSKMIAYYNREVIDDAGDEYNLLGWTKKRGDGKSVQGFKTEKRVFSACAGAALYRKSIFDEIGYFDEDFFAYMEDVDIGYRANIHGYKNIYCPDAKVYHIGSATSGSRYNTFKVRLSARNNIYVAYKNMPLIQLIFNVPFLFSGYLIKYLFFTRKGLGKVYKEGILEGMKSLKKIEKYPFKWRNLKYYIYIEYLLIKNLVLFFIVKDNKK